MNIDTTIKGYVVDCIAVCPSCVTEAEERNPEIHVILGYNEGEWLPEGLTCDRCHDWIVEGLEPSFKAIHGREPVPGKDYDPDDLCQDDYEFLTGTGRYSDKVQP